MLEAVRAARCLPWKRPQAPVPTPGPKRGERAVQRRGCRCPLWQKGASGDVSAACSRVCQSLGPPCGLEGSLSRAEEMLREHCPAGTAHGTTGSKQGMGVSEPQNGATPGPAGQQRRHTAQRAPFSTSSVTSVTCVLNDASLTGVRGQLME